MRFLTLVILPEDTDISNSTAIETAVAALMKPFESTDESILGDRDYYWDYYSCCTRGWLWHHGENYLDYSGCVLDHPYILFPTERLTKAGQWGAAIVTPDGEWHDSDDAEDAEAYVEMAFSLSRKYIAHFAVLVSCHL